eukprot:1750444-Prymnesium_polylepis.2
MLRETDGTWNNGYTHTRGLRCEYVTVRGTTAGKVHRWCEVQIKNGHTQHTAQGQAQRERGKSDTPRPKADAANTRTRSTRTHHKQGPSLV